MSGQLLTEAKHWQLPGVQLQLWVQGGSSWVQFVTEPPFPVPWGVLGCPSPVWPWQAQGE